MKRIGFVGVGIMGKSMARNLMKAGFKVDFFARNREKAADLIAEGARFHETIGDCVKGADTVITIVGYPADVEEVYLAPGNIFDSAAPGTYLIDMTTSSPALAERLHALGIQRGLRVLDAPVTGGDVGAKNGTLSILVGGERGDFDACMPIFQAMGANINHLGAAGCGQHAKLANQIMIAGALSGVCEALAYAKAKGLDLPTLSAAVATGAAGSRQLDNLGPKIMKGDYAPGFFAKHFIKDMRLAVEEAERSGLALDVLGQVLGNFEGLAEAGYADLGTQALIKHYEK